MKFFKTSNLIFASIIAVLAAGYFYSQSKSRVIVKFNGTTMGTQYAVVVSEYPGAKISEKGLKAAVEELLREMNDQMSTYIADSEISKFNRYSAPGPFKVSKEHYEVAKMAKEVSSNTGAAFEPSVEPLVNIWGFGPKGIPTKIPTQAQIDKAMNEVGIDDLELIHKGEDFFFSKKRPDLKVDFSAIAKGYAVDLISKFLFKTGHKNHMVEIGGEIRVSGYKGDKLKWAIGIEKPKDDTRTALTKLNITDKAIATSGSYRNYYEKNGKRYSHTIDARTGMPIEHNMISVSVLTGSCGLADAYATAFMVMGPKQTMEFAEKNNLEVFALVKDGEKIVTLASSSFKQNNSWEDL